MNAAPAPVAMLSRKHPGTRLLSGLLPAAALLALALLPPRWAALPAVALAAAAAYYGLSRSSRNKGTLWCSGAILLACLLTLDGHTDGGRIVAALHRFSPVMLLLVGIALFRHSVARSGLAALMMRHLLVQGQERRNALRVAGLTGGLAVLSGQGSVALLCTALYQQVRNPLAIPRSTNRAMVATMFVLPTTIASAAVAAAIPHLDVGAVAWTGLPLALWSLAGALVPRLAVLPQAPQAPTQGNPWRLALVFAIASVLIYAVGGQMTLAFAGAMVSGYLVELLLAAPGGAATLWRDGVRSLDGIVPELCLLAVTGLLIFTIEQRDLLGHMPLQLLAALSHPLGALLLLIVVLPLATMAGLHPLILFGLFFSLVQPASFAHGHVRYLAWTTMFVTSSLLSPVSILAIVTATSIQSNSRATSYLAHWKFCAGLMLFAIGYLYWLAGQPLAASP